MSAICTVRGSTARTSFTTPGVPRTSCDAAFGTGAFAAVGWSSRSRLSTTCWAVRTVPSWKRTPSRSRKLQASPSRETDHWIASPGSMSLVTSRYCTRVSNICRAMTETGPSSAVAGSRVAATVGSPTRSAPPWAPAEPARASRRTIVSPIPPITRRRAIPVVIRRNTTGARCVAADRSERRERYGGSWHQNCLLKAQWNRLHRATGWPRRRQEPRSAGRGFPREAIGDRNEGNRRK